MRKWQKTRIIVLSTGIMCILIFTYYEVLIWSQNPPKELSIGESFHRQTSLTWAEVLADIFRTKPKSPLQYKIYSGAQRIKLSEPDYQRTAVEEAIKKRRSVRNFSSQPLSITQLSQLLFAAQGITGQMYGQPLRSVPSAGALYPMEIYLIVNNVKALSSGIYHYSILDHTLELIKPGDFRKQIINAGLKQEMLGQAAVTFVLSAIFDRTRSKYGKRGFRYVYIEGGHISQNIYLQAVSLGLGSVSVGAFFR